MQILSQVSERPCLAQLGNIPIFNCIFEFNLGGFLYRKNQHSVLVFSQISFGKFSNYIFLRNLYTPFSENAANKEAAHATLFSGCCKFER